MLPLEKQKKHFVERGLYYGHRKAGKYFVERVINSCYEKIGNYFDVGG